MLEDILASDSESTILSFLLVAPPRMFSGLELSRRLGLQIPALISALDHMHRQGQLRVVTKNGRRYFSLNQKYRMFPEIRASLLKGKPTYEDELFSAVKKLGAVNAAFLTGLFVGLPDLPVDIVIVGAVSTVKVERFIEACEKMMEQEINYSVFSLEEFKERNNTFDRFIKDIFDHPYITVINKIK